MILPFREVFIFAKGSASAKFRENKTLAKISEFTVLQTTMHRSPVIWKLLRATVKEISKDASFILINLKIQDIGGHIGKLVLPMTHKCFVILCFLANTRSNNSFLALNSAFEICF